MRQPQFAALSMALFIAAAPRGHAASINRADIGDEMVHRRAEVIDVEAVGNTFALNGRESRDQLLQPVRVHTKPTAVIFINKTAKPIFVQQQPPQSDRRTACETKLNATALMSLCEIAGGDADTTKLCEGIRALVERCATDPKYDVATMVNLVPPGGSFEVHMTLADKPMEYVIRGAPEDKIDPAAIRLDSVSGEAPATNLTLRAAVVPLDSTGVASWHYMNPMNPACIRCGGKAKDSSAVNVVFENRTVDRSFVVSLAVPSDVAESAKTRGLAKCKGKACTVSIKVQPHDTGVFDAALINALPVDRLLRFDVAFFDELQRVPNPTAYLSQLPTVSKDPNTPTLQELESQTTFDATGKLTKIVDPDVGKPLSQTDDTFAAAPCHLAGDPFAPSLCAGAPFLGALRRHNQALARLDMTQNLGNRADASVTMGLVSSDLGGKDDGKVALTQYTINVYSRINLGLQFGRTTFLDSANSIALSEKGDGFRWLYLIPLSDTTFSATRILKRESEAGTPTRFNRDNSEWLFQLRGVHFLGNALERAVKNVREKPLNVGLRSVDVLYLGGHEKGNTPGVDGKTMALSPYAYRTLGGEVFYAFPRIHCVGDIDDCKHYGSVSGSLAIFRSKRHVELASPDCASRICDGSGQVALLSATWTPRFQTTDEVTSSAKRFMTLLLGQGSGDRVQTRGKDEGYAGETAAFAPDVFFLSMFEPAVDTAQRHPIGASLSNKTYVGLQFTDNTFSPLQWIARRFGIERTELASKSTILRLHDYRFREPVNGAAGHAACEADIDFQAEYPRGINVTIGAARIWPGAALRPAIQRSAWGVNASVSLKL